MTELPCVMADLKNVSLNGELPPGVPPETFANPAEIRKRATLAVLEDKRLDAFIERLRQAVTAA
jgi:fructose-1-phosphate kinase PfkB-like protein